MMFTGSPARKRTSSSQSTTSHRGKGHPGSSESRERGSNDPFRNRHEVSLSPPHLSFFDILTVRIRNPASHSSSRTNSTAAGMRPFRDGNSGGKKIHYI
ncbi:unnamed protein product [Allacma fusca]|uniref:Uncharacterized protein n=1 Tax=Allacma fusca TaxID=39272 RepID=A0A8J2J6J9_9HEXA|nr:unnamed protein product [Allacma fusca]